MIADDEPSISNLLGRLLKVLGYRVAGMACNGLEAVEMVRTLQPDFLVLDIAMPVMNGLDAAQQILSEREIPIIICSGVMTADNRERVAQLRIEAFVSKPFTVNDLKAALELAGVARETRSVRVPGACSPVA